MFNIFRKKSFKFVGTRNTFRNEEELKCINKEEADRSFKKYQKEIIDVLLLNRGFYKWKTNAYVRINKIGLLEYLNLQKERYGSKTFCVNFSVMPLYINNEYIVTGLGYRLGTYISKYDVWWDYGNDKVAKESFKNVADAINIFVLPWFDNLSQENEYKKRLLSDKNKDFVGYDVEKWLKALDYDNKDELINLSINNLKLPKKILDNK